MDATPTSNFCLNTIFSLTCYTLLQDEHMHDIPKTFHGVENTEVLSFLELSRKCSR